MMGKPSFKRLPSQTLGPDNSKRPLYGFGVKWKIELEVDEVRLEVIIMTVMVIRMF